jgi:WD40 repeat protein
MPYWTAKKRMNYHRPRRKFQLGHLLSGPSSLLYINDSVTLVKRHSENTRTNPEGLVFLRDSTALVYSAREDHILHYIDLPTFALSGYNLNPNGDSWVSFSVYVVSLLSHLISPHAILPSYSLSISIHPTLPILCLQTSTTSSRILLYPFRSAQRLSTLFTTAEQSDFGTPRHSWLPDGTAVVVTSEDGVLRIIDLQGKVRMRIGAHGAASPIGDDEGSVEGRSERVRARREMERGSSVVKDVACIEDPVTGELSFVSGGFDKTIRVISV